MDNDILVSLVRGGFTQITVDASKGCYMGGWHKASRSYHQATGTDPREVADDLIARLSKKPSAPADMFEDLLG